MDDPESWNTVVLAGIKVPGLAKVVGNVSRKLDVKNAKGVDGATVTDDGADPSKIEITILLRSRAEWASFQQLIPLLNPNVKKGTAAAIDVSYPSLSLYGIRQMYVEEMSTPVDGSVSQTKEVTIRGMGWLPPPAKPKSSKSATPDTSASDQSLAYALAKAEEARGIAGAGGNVTDEQRYNANAEAAAAWDRYEQVKRDEVDSAP
jgi:hypothetical protein